MIKQTVILFVSAILSMALFIIIIYLVALSNKKKLLKKQVCQIQKDNTSENNDGSFSESQRICGCKKNKKLDMVFNKNVERKQLEEFENNNLQQVSASPMFALLKDELLKKELIYKIEVQHCESDLNKYHLELTINIFNENDERVSECDEPNCSLMLCEPICFMRNGRIVGVNLLTDKNFLKSLDLLIKQVEKHT